jgi:hypothetical protein
MELELIGLLVGVLQQRGRYGRAQIEPWGGGKWRHTQNPPQEDRRAIGGKGPSMAKIFANETRQHVELLVTWGRGTPRE